MRTYVVIDDQLMRQAMRASGLPTKRAVIEAALRLLIEVKGQSAVRRLRGKVRWEGDLDEMRAARAR
jgi:Arc/MetJ family transcription regulator